MKNLYNIRKSLWILFCCMSLLAANGIPATLHAQERKRLTVEMTDAPILDVLKAIEAQSELSFFYNNNLIDPTLRITVSKRDAPIPEVLNRVFAGTPYAYRIVDKQVLISKKEDAPKPDKPLKIQGRVIDSKGGPIVGATVVNMRTLQGTVTDSDGRFELTVSALTEELTFNYIGFKTKVLPASNAEEVRLEEATVLEDVVVVGYGTVKRVNLTGSVATIDMREKANQPITNTAQAMYNTPGVWINQNNAKPGADGGTIRIRGVNTLSSANPLVLLDGVEDPHNLGAIIRTANQAGAHGVIIPKRRAVGLTATVARTSAGALNYTPVAKVTNLVKTMEDLKKKGLWFVCADMDGDVMYDVNMKGPIGLVIGNEGEGVGRLVKDTCDFTARIPMKGDIDSLNASVAAGVLAYEIVRQRSV